MDVTKLLLLEVYVNSVLPGDVPDGSNVEWAASRFTEYYIRYSTIFANQSELDWAW